MKPACWRATFLVGCAVGCIGACGGGGARQSSPEEPASHSELADEDRFVPGYGKPELQRALIAERGAEATAERLVAELDGKPDRAAADDDRLRVALADLAVRRRFITSLETCEATGRWCPPRLDEPVFAFDPDPDRPTSPPIDAPRRFDLDGWRQIAAELHGRACACRTLACIDAVGVAIDELEPRPAAEVEQDDTAILAITRARECLFRLRGKAGLRTRVPAEPAGANDE